MYERRGTLTSHLCVIMLINLSTTMTTESSRNEHINAQAKTDCRIIAVFILSAFVHWTFLSGDFLFQTCITARSSPQSRHRERLNRHSHRDKNITSTLISFLYPAAQVHFSVLALNPFPTLNVSFLLGGLKRLFPRELFPTPVLPSRTTRRVSTSLSGGPKKLIFFLLAISLLQLSPSSSSSSSSVLSMVSLSLLLSISQ